MFKEVRTTWAPISVPIRPLAFTGRVVCVTNEEPRTGSHQQIHRHIYTRAWSFLACSSRSILFLAASCFAKAASSFFRASASRRCTCCRSSSWSCGVTVTTRLLQSRLFVRSRSCVAFQGGEKKTLKFSFGIGAAPQEKMGQNRVLSNRGIFGVEVTTQYKVKMKRLQNIPLFSESELRRNAEAKTAKKTNFRSETESRRSASQSEKGLHDRVFVRNRSCGATLHTEGKSVTF